MAAEQLVLRIREMLPVTSNDMVAVLIMGLERCAQSIDQVATWGNDKLSGYQPFWLCVVTAVSVIVTTRVVKRCFCYDGFIPVNQRPRLLQRLRNLPGIRCLVQKKLAVMRREIDHDLNKHYDSLPMMETLPKNRWNPNDIWKSVCKYEDVSPIPWKQGRASGAVYSANDEDLEQLIHRVFAKTLKTNPLHAGIFCGVRRMEAEIIQWVLRLFNAPKDGAGSISSGGTESIMLACKTYRDYAFASRGITKPEMVIPSTAHAAFLKSAEYLRITAHTIPVDKRTKMADVRAMRKAINANTIMLVASAPQFPHGIIDPVEEIAALGNRYGIPVHVDCCLGGFVLPFMKDAGYSVPPFDFSVRGVTSISADTHKYAMAPKGTSVVMYASHELHRHQFCISTDWPGGVYATACVSGSRSGAMVACCWAAMLYHGYEGYVDACKQIIKLAHAIRDGIREIEGLVLMGDPQASVVAFTSNVFHILEWNQRMHERHWELNTLQFPMGVHLCVTMMHVKEKILDDFLRDAREIAQILIKDPPEKLCDAAAFYGSAPSIPDRSIVAEIAQSYLESCYCSAKIDA